MTRSGTIKTLALLVASMSLGTCLLLWMETGPARPEGSLPLQAIKATQSGPELAIVHQTDGGIPIQFIKWRNVIIHDTGQDGPKIAKACHFVVGSAETFGDGHIRCTRAWRRQQDGAHISVPGFNFNSNSIGICVMGDARRYRPTSRQFESLVRLVRTLQITCSIPRDHVYLHSDLGEPGCPGRHFPAKGLRERLIPAVR